MSSIAITIIIALLGIGIGVAFGLLIAGMRTETKSGESNREQRMARAGMRELVRIWQKGASRDYLVEIDKTMIKSPSELSARQSRQLLEIIDRLKSWESAQAGNKGQIGDVPQPEDLPSIRVHSSQAEVQPGPAEASPDVPRMNPVDIFTNALQTDVPQSTEVASIGAQVDEILQKKLEGTVLETQGIRLMELPNKGLVVMVGLDQYDRVEDVPNPEIRNLIRLAVEEWERENWKD
jgi:hypothetical protein